MPAGLPPTRRKTGGFRVVSEDPAELPSAKEQVPPPLLVPPAPVDMEALAQGVARYLVQNGSAPLQVEAAKAITKGVTPDWARHALFVLALLFFMYAAQLAELWGTPARVRSIEERLGEVEENIDAIKKTVERMEKKLGAEEP